MDSKDLVHDMAVGEVRAIAIIATRTGPWAICRVANHNASVDDFYRAYPNQDFSSKVGLVCAMGNSVEDVAETARTWS